jgi:hypothetical protein
VEGRQALPRAVMLRGPLFSQSKVLSQMDRLPFSTLEEGSVSFAGSQFDENWLEKIENIVLRVLLPGFVSQTFDSIF